jgi:hypothetical protein
MFIMSTAARANDTSSLKAELADLKAKVAAMESREMAPAAGGDAESLTSMKKKGAIKIGGNVEVVLMAKTRDEDPTARHGEDDNVSSTEFTTYDADLVLDVAASKDMGLMLLLDLDDAWNQTTDQDDLLEECYFYWKNVGGSNVQLNFGKKEVPFGQDKRVAFFYGYVHGQMTPRTSILAASEMQDGSVGNAHVSVGNAATWAGEIDNVFQVEAIYSYKDLAKFYASVFQSNTTTGATRQTRGMHEDRSDDTMFFQSFALKAEVMPIEGLTLQLSFVNEHVDSFGDEVTDLSLQYAEEDTQAISFGVDYKFKSVPVEIFAEYIHNFDWQWDDRGDADIAQIGVIWGVTENIDLGLQVDYAEIDMDSGDIAVGAYSDQDFWAVDLAMTYKFDNGISATLEYRHEWFDGDRRAADDLDADADAIGLVVAWSF